MNMHCVDSGALCAVLIAAEGSEAVPLATFEQVLEARNDNLFRFGNPVIDALFILHSCSSVLHAFHVHHSMD